MPTYVVPTFHEEPPNLFGVHVPSWSARKLFHDLGFGPIYLDVSWCRAAGWVTGIGGADVGDFEHHVWRAIFIPKRNTDVLHAVAWSSKRKSVDISSCTSHVESLRLRSAYLRKYGWIATLLIWNALSGMPQALWLAESVAPGIHWSVSPVGVFSCPAGKNFMLPCWMEIWQSVRPHSKRIPSFEKQLQTEHALITS